MLGTHFYNETIRRTVIGFGTLFNNIEIKKKNPVNNEVVETEKVALGYGPKNKFLYRLFENPKTQKVAITMPRMYFEMTGIDYDSARKTSPVRKYKNVIQGDGSEVRVQYVPVPYTLGFELGILSKDQDTGLQILEQILPYFQPAFNITLNMVPDMSEKKDVAITLNSINMEDEWDDSFLERRLVVYTLQFTAKTFLYGPYNKADIIRKATVYESVGDKAVSRRAVKMEYTPKAKVDKNQDGQIDANDDILITPDDDFGFNSGFEIL
tara:strand:- start:110 stop:910 length:801 start_codon:yes stop_codon:yes gene_type:complete